MNFRKMPTATPLPTATGAGLSSAPPPDRARDTLHQIGQSFPAAATADQLLKVSTVPVVPIDPDTLEPTADPLRDHVAAASHWSGRAADGVGVPMGGHAGGTLFAIATDPQTWRRWLADNGRTIDRGGRIGTNVQHLNPGTHVAVTVQAPPGPAVRSAFAGPRDDHGFKALRRRRLQHLTADMWLVWQTRTPVRLRNRTLSDGVKLVADGIVPWHVHRPDGTTLRASHPPRRDQLPADFATTLGAKE